MSSQASFPAQDGAAVPVVNTIQTVKAPILSVPTLSDGQLNIGAVEVVPTSPYVDTMQVTVDPQLLGAASATIPTGRTSTRRVVVKPLVHKQPSPSLGPSQQSLSPVKGLPQYPQITPQQAQSLLKQLAGSVATSPMQTSLSPQRPQPVLQMLPTAGMVQAASQARVLRAGGGGGGVGGGGGGAGLRASKPIMPKPADAVSLLSAAAALPTVNQQQQGSQLSAPAHALQQVQRPVVVPSTQKITAPVAVLAPRASIHTSESDEAVDPSHQHPPPSHPTPPHQPAITTTKARKPCNCKNSQCLKLYCDCFANGEFCRDGCNCHHCKNNMDHAEDRARAVKTCLDRNPNAFKPKVGHSRSQGGDERRHIKGCNCKRSGCLKNYCECFEAKIPCSTLCRCVGCKNVAEKPENKSLMHLADAADIRTQQQRAATSHFMEQLEASSVKPQPTTRNGQRLPFSFINKEVSKATCLCLLEEASHAEMNGKTPVEVERAVLEEFGRCMTQIINSTQTANEDGRATLVQ